MSGFIIIWSYENRSFHVRDSSNFKCLLTSKSELHENLKCFARFFFFFFFKLETISTLKFSSSGTVPYLLSNKKTNEDSSYKFGRAVALTKKKNFDFWISCFFFVSLMFILVSKFSPYRGLVIGLLSFKFGLKAVRTWKIMYTIWHKLIGWGLHWHPKWYEVTLFPLDFFITLLYTN